jgi:hypothetical protein
MFLTREELVALTGWKIARRQIEWLRVNRWRYVIGRDGYPRVSRGFFEYRMDGEREAPPSVAPEGPNWAALERALLEKEKRKCLAQNSDTSPISTGNTGTSVRGRKNGLP